MKDYKEIWQAFYDQYIEAGLSESEASIRANTSLGDCCADLADRARDKAKEELLK